MEDETELNNAENGGGKRGFHSMAKSTKFGRRFPKITSTSVKEIQTQNMHNAIEEIKN